METGTILLFYKYVSIEDPCSIRDWQLEVCRRWQLVGKIRIASEGINVTVSGVTHHVFEYQVELLRHPLFGDTPIKSSIGSPTAFASLSVKICSEAIPTGLKKGLPLPQTGKHLKPDEAHALLSHPPDNLVILDARNYYESRIGHFEGAVLPNVRKFSYFFDYMKEQKDSFKDKQVFMYCTGGIRCERASAYLKSLNVCEEVYQLEGGIHEYANCYPNGFYKGRNYVFDDRISMKINDTVVSTCNYCTNLYDEYRKCCRPDCFIVTLCCDSCRETRKNLYFCCLQCEKFYNVQMTATLEELGHGQENCHESSRRSICTCQTVRNQFATVEDYYRSLKGVT